MSNIWVVVADEAKARILSSSNSTEPLLELKMLSSPEAHLLEQDLVSDKSGRSFDSAGRGRHSMEEKSEYKEHYAINFAKDINNYLEKHRQLKSYSKLIIVAAPHFLGVLRKELSKGIVNSISLEIDKDLTMLESQKIRDHLPQYL
jgi:protein required for attachment to host cells